MNPGGRGLAAGICIALSLTGRPAVRAQVVGEDELARPWTFPVGERMEFSVTWGRLRLGEGSLAIEAIDTIAGHPAYRVAMEMWGGPPFYRVQDRQVTWIRPLPLGSVRFEQRLSEGSYKRDRRYEFDVDRLTYDRYDLSDDEWQLNDSESGVAIPAGALDDLSYLFLARLLPLEIGHRYEFERYFRESGNPLVIEVLRREEIRVPAGVFQTIVLRPLIKTGGAFGDGGEAELYLTDDENRAIVRLKTSMKVGAGNLYLTGYEPGDGPVIPTSHREIDSARSASEPEVMP